MIKLIDILKEIKINKPPRKIWNINNTIVKTQDVEVGDIFKIIFYPYDLPEKMEYRKIIKKLERATPNEFNLIDEDERYWNDIHLRDWYNRCQEAKKYK